MGQELKTFFNLINKITLKKHEQKNHTIKNAK